MINDGDVDDETNKNNKKINYFNILVKNLNKSVID